jgi:hypothetical protein
VFVSTAVLPYAQGARKGAVLEGAAGSTRAGKVISQVKKCWVWLAVHIELHCVCEHSRITVRKVQGRVQFKV